MTTEAIGAARTSTSGLRGLRENTGNSMAGIDELYRWLIAMSMQVRKPEHVAERIEDTVRVYAEKLTAWPAPTVRRLLERWPSESDWWPTWHELEARLPDRGPLRLAHGDGRSGGGWGSRCERLGITGRRLGNIGVGRWREVMDRHRELSDDELLAAIARLERGDAA